MKKNPESSWETSSSWYDKIVGVKGHYYHQMVILPGVLRILAENKVPKPHLLDLACGQGVLSRHLPKEMHYLGIDASNSLIQSAQKEARLPTHRFLTHDLMQPLDLPSKNFTHATCILAAQNLPDLTPLLETARRHLLPGSPLIFVLNHPCFRIPRQSSWGIDEKKKLQYRRIERYLSPLKIPIQTHPGERGESVETLSYHLPLSSYSAALKKAGFYIDSMEEWCSDKKSTGKMAAMENRSRGEFPLFLTLVAKKN
ncbi:MAG: class I SAM-dependent methyltransferase [Verrucomicrobia bacterium]|nr:class I SAM-dependent methyltransferase [Verrucomicrobiota bacterium]